MSDIVKKQAFEIFDLLSEREQVLVFELIRTLAPDDIATPEDIAAHLTAMDEFARGEYTRHEDIDWD